MGRASSIATCALLTIIAWPLPADFLPRHARDSAVSPAELRAGFGWQPRFRGSSTHEPGLSVHGAGTRILGCLHCRADSAHSHDPRCPKEEEGKYIRAGAPRAPATRKGVDALPRALRGGGDDEVDDLLTPEEKTWMAALENAPMQELLEVAWTLNPNP